MFAGATAGMCQVTSLSLIFSLSLFHSFSFSCFLQNSLSCMTLISRHLVCGNKPNGNRQNQNADAKKTRRRSTIGCSWNCQRTRNQRTLHWRKSHSSSVHFIIIIIIFIIFIIIFFFSYHLFDSRGRIYRNLHIHNMRFLQIVWKQRYSLLDHLFWVLWLLETKVDWCKRSHFHTQSFPRLLYCRFVCSHSIPLINFQNSYFTQYFFDSFCVFFVPFISHFRNDCGCFSYSCWCHQDTFTSKNTSRTRTLQGSHWLLHSYSESRRFSRPFQRCSSSCDGHLSTLRYCTRCVWIPKENICEVFQILKTKQWPLTTTTSPQIITYFNDKINFCLLEQRL